MERNIKACLFDLDGTLLNTLDDLADCANTVLAERGMPTHPIDAYRFHVGNGIRVLMQRAAPAATDEQTLDELNEAMMQLYAKNWANKTRPYPGIVDMLTKLEGTGLPLAVLSNKPHLACQETVRLFFPQAKFFKVQGQEDDKPRKPDPFLALSLAAEMGLAPENILFLGDSSVDMDTAVAAGMLPVGALWGFRPESELREHGAQHLLTSPDEIFALLG